MSKVRRVTYLSYELDKALEDYARRRGVNVSVAAEGLLQRALYGALDEGTEAMLVPEIRKAVREAAGREIRETVTRLLEAQTNRLYPALVTYGRDAFVARQLARDCYEDLTDDPEAARERERDAALKARTRYTRDGLDGATADPQGTTEQNGA